MPGTTRQADELRGDLADLVELADGDLSVVWGQVDTPGEVRDALIEVLPRLVTVYGTAAGTLAADWYDELRDMSEIDGRFRAIVAELPADMGTDELARWGVTPLYQQDPDWSAAQAAVAGGLQRRILHQSRRTITGSSLQDPRSYGWQRVGHGECDWCEMLISRGAVYSRDTVDFAAHDHCRCGAVPAWKGREVPVKPYTPGVRQSKADQQRAKRWIRDNL